MPDLQELLNRATPADLDPIDVGVIARSARRRRRNRNVATLMTGLVAVSLVAAVTATVVHRPGEDRQQVTAAAPDTRTLTAGMGTWRRLPDAPFSGATSTAPLKSGRLLAWSDERAAFGDNEDPGDAGLAVAIYDPDEEAWTAIDRSPVLDGIQYRATLVAEGRLLVLGMADDGTFRGAVLDTGTRTWTPIPDLVEIRVRLDAVAWDGTTLTVVRTDPGKVGRVGTSKRPHDVSDPNDGVVTLDWRVDGPVTRRWTFGSQTWTNGAPPQLSMRITVGSAFDGRHLAIVGGTEGPGGTNDGSLTRADGAIYNVATDAWRPLPELPWAATNPGVAWIDGRLVVAGGTPDLSLEPLEEPIARVAALDANGTKWSPWPSPPRHGAGVTWPSAAEHLDGGEPLVEQSSFVGDPAEPEGSVLLDGRWEPTPTRTLHRWDGLLVSSSDTIGNPGSQPFEIQVRRGANDWMPAAKAPFGNRMQPAGVAVVGDLIYVVGGVTGTALKPDASAWVLDLSSTR